MLPAPAPMPRNRLDPAIFRLPEVRIREGYYSDAYFNFTKELLEATDHRPRVLMQVFQKRESLLGGIDEAVAILSAARAATAAASGRRAGTSSRSTRSTRPTRSRRARR